jgi:hypothetical protein
MTSFVQVAGSTQHTGVARFERAAETLKEVVRDLRAVFANWTAVSRELSDLRGNAKLNVRSHRMMRAWY